jgi:hypothetical protein
LNPTETNRVHWLLRSYFWELVGAFDMMLQWANDRFARGIPEHDVRWAKMPKTAMPEPKVWERVRAALKAAWDSEWFFEVRTYRNFSHRSFLHLTALIPKKGGKPQVMLEHARTGQKYYEDLRIQLPKYLDATRALGAILFQSLEPDDTLDAAV